MNDPETRPELTVAHTTEKKDKRPAYGAQAERVIKHLKEKQKIFPRIRTILVTPKVYEALLVADNVVLDRELGRPVLHVRDSGVIKSYEIIAAESELATDFSFSPYTAADLLGETGLEIPKLSRVKGVSGDYAILVENLVTGLMLVNNTIAVLYETYEFVKSLLEACVRELPQRLAEQRMRVASGEKAGTVVDPVTVESLFAEKLAESRENAQ